MDENVPLTDLSREDVVIFVAERILCERLGGPIDAAVVALADMSVSRGVSLVRMARDVLAGEVDPLASGHTRGTRVGL